MSDVGRITVQVVDQHDPSQSKVMVLDAKLSGLHRHVTEYMGRHNLRRFVETGTGMGQSLVYAQSLPFITLWSCELDQRTLDTAFMVHPQLSEPRTTLFKCRSLDMLEQLGELPTDEPILFWLDAHFPGTCFGNTGYGGEADPELRMPLSEELQIIRMLRPLCEDVILIDDLWFWRDADDYGDGTLPDAIEPYCPLDGIEFVERLFARTHNIETHTDYSGWLSLTPRIIHE